MPRSDGRVVSGRLGLEGPDGLPLKRVIQWLVGVWRAYVVEVWLLFLFRLVFCWYDCVLEVDRVC